MKKIITFVIFSLFSLSIVAKETVTIVFAFGPADSVANYGRSLADEANQIQNKYTFVFDTKPGAGNSIAANYVKNTPNTILATSSAFFIRPIFYPNESYDISEFRELMPQCDAPMVIASQKYKDWNSVPKDKDLTIGTTGLGVTSHLIALQILEKYPNIRIVPFKSPSDVMLAILSGTVDFGVGFVSEVESYTKESKHTIHILGTTGGQQVKKYPLLAEQGFPLVLSKLNNPQHLMVPKSMDPEKYQEIRSILVKAGRSKVVKNFYDVDSCISLSDLPDSKIDNWSKEQQLRWKKITNGVKLDR